MAYNDRFSHRVFLGLGSNIGEREKNLQSALALLTKDGLIDLVHCSTIYRTEGVDSGRGEPEYLNQVIEVNTALPPHHLLKVCRRVEEKLGRPSRRKRSGPRVLDIDILFYDDIIVNNEELVIPHPRAARRCFVLKPLAEIAPDFLHPVMQMPISKLLESSDDNGWVKEYERKDKGKSPIKPKAKK